VTTDPISEAWPAATPAAWREQALRELQGAPLERLTARTAEGLEILPLYEPAAPRGLAPLRRAGGWTPCPEYAGPSPAAVRAAIAADRGHGAAVWLRLDERVAAGVSGPAAPRGLHGAVVRGADDLAVALAEVDLARTPVVIAAGAAGLAAAASLATVAARRGVATAALQGAVGCDPLGALAVRGALGWPIEHALKDMSEVAGWAAGAAPGLRTALVDVGPWHDAGATAADQLAALLATGTAYLRALTAGGLAVAEACARLLFAAAVGRDLLLEVAKLRAARLCWGRVVAASGGDPRAPMRLHARGSWRERTAVDPWTGLLRATGETVAAALGGADTISTTAMDAALGEPGELGRRMALGVQHLLAEESRLAGVADPTGGAGCVEALTDGLARAAWDRFRAIEAAGGMAAALLRGAPQQAAAAAAAAQARAAATLRAPVIGVSRFAAPHGPPTGAREVEDPLAGEADLAPGTGREEARDGAGRSTGDMAPGTGREGARDGAGRSTGDLAPGTGREEARDGAGRSTGDLAPGTGPEGQGAEDRAFGTGAMGQVLGDMSGALAGALAGAPVLAPGAGARVRAPALVRARPAAVFEALRAAGEAHAARTGAAERVALVAVGTPAQWRARVEFCRGYFAVAGLAAVETAGASEVAEAAAQFAATGARAAVICSSDPVYPEVVPALAPALRAAGAAVVLLAGRPKDHAEALQAAGVELFVQLGGDAAVLLAELQRRLEVRP
jgi:methylmalonyl-CoA mutase